jgi:hypothetical protein
MILAACAEPENAKVIMIAAENLRVIEEVILVVAPFDVFQIMPQCVPCKLNCCLSDGSCIIQK